MADKTIGQLKAASQVTPADLFVLEQSGVAKKLTGQTLENWLLTFADGHGGIQSIAKTSTSGLTDTYTITLSDNTTVTFTVRNGKGISSVTTYYAVSTSGSTVPSSWSTARQTMTATNKYLWSYQHIAFNDNTSVDTVKTVIGVYGDKGDKGNTGDTGNGISSLAQTGRVAGEYTIYTFTMTNGTTQSFNAYDGVGISSINTYYAVSADGTTPPTSWSESRQNMTATNRYLWSYQEIHLSDNTTISTQQIVIGVYGDKGDKGDPGEVTQAEFDELDGEVDNLQSALNALEDNGYNSLSYQTGGEGRIRHDNGLAVAGADYTYTDYLDISKYKSLRYKRAGTTSATGTSGMAFYNAEKSYVSGQQVALSQPQFGYVADLSEVPVPPDAVYARFSMLKNTSTYGTFEVFGYSEPTHQLNKIGNDLPVYKGSISNGVFSDSYYNVYIPVSPRSTLKITAGDRTVAYGALRSLTIPPVAGTNADFSQTTGWVGTRSLSPGESVDGVLPDDANYLFVYYGTATTLRLPAELKINGIDILDISGSLTGNIALLADKVNKLHPKTEKTIAFFGDSIVAGSGVTGEPDSQIFHQYIHDLYGFTCLNYGYGSSGYIRNFTGTGGLMGQGQPGIGVSITTTTKLVDNTVLARLQSIQNPTFDAVVIFAGTNDWRHQDTYPYADFLTALENTFSYYQSNYWTIPLLVMTPIKRKGGDVIAEERPKTMSDYRDAIIDMCKKYAVPYVDTMTYSGLNPDNTSNYNLFYMRDDTEALDIVHVNHLAHQRIARVIGEVLNQLVLWNSDIVR